MPHATDRSGRPSGGRALPAQALTGLREAFAGEVATRLPRLRALAAGQVLDAEAFAVVLRDAHSLGSSAVVVGEPEASRAARALERELDGLGPDAALPPSVPAGVQALSDLLAPWAAA